MHDIDTTRLEYNPQFEQYPDREAEGENYEGEGEVQGQLSDAEEEVLAAELLSVSNEAEMDQFLGGLFNKLKRTIGGAAKFLAKNGGPLPGVLSGVAAKALPF